MTKIAALVLHGTRHETFIFIGHRGVEPTDLQKEMAQKTRASGNMIRTPPRRGGPTKVLRPPTSPMFPVVLQWMLRSVADGSAG